MKNSNNLINYTNESPLSYIVGMENELDFSRYPVNAVILCKIEPKSNNSFYNKDTEFPLITELSNYIVQNNNISNPDEIIKRLNTMGAGWRYSDPILLKKGATIQLFDDEIKFVELITDGVNKKIVFEDKEGKAVSMDFKNNAFIEHIYKEITKQNPQQGNKPRKNSTKLR